MTTSSLNQADNLPLYLVVYQYQQYLYKLIHHFPKAYKYTLGQNILDLNWQLLDLIIVANSLPNTQKPPSIQKASSTFDQCKFRLKMAYDLKLIPPTKYAYIITVHEKTGKMLTGWLKWAKRQNTASKP
ncbi:MAG TPA: four helix bundle protein [Candidatus Woesebacteria bacterium]|nr:four helix bundle protein [Candidatus Woesebacteria bacterium]